MYSKYISIIILSIALAIFGCNQPPKAIPGPTADDTASSSSNNTFNVKDIMVSSNGNITVAALKISGQTSDFIWQDAKDIAASVLTKNPYSSLGKLCKISGRVYRVEELPPDFGLVGHWSEISMLTPNRNAPLKSTNISFVFNGDVTNINSGNRITCAGYYAGNYESENAMGGTLEGLVIIGNAYNPYKRPPVVPEEYSPRK
jgi:hypothetical protein